MRKFIFMVQPSVGHLNPLLNIALRLAENGHSVRFLVPGMRIRRSGIRIFDTGLDIPAQIRHNGIRADLLRPHPALLWDAFRLPSKSGYAETAHAFGMFFKGMNHYAYHIMKDLWRDPPDVVVADFAFPAAALAADAAGIPYAAIYHSGLPFRGPGIPPFGSGLPIGGDYSDATDPLVRREARLLALIDKRVARSRRAFGLPPAAPDLLRRPYSPWLNLIASAEILEAPRDNLTANTFFIGPCFGRRAEETFPFESLRPDRFKVYVSLGTVFNDRPEVFNKILRALSGPDYQVIVSAGGAYRALARGTLPANATLYRSVPQIALLERIDLFVSHGGNNSTNEALAAGKPILVLPVGGEQSDNASRVVYLGAGKRADIADFTQAQLLGLVEEMRRTPAYRMRAEALREGLRPLDGTSTAASCLAWLAERKRPLYRKEGFPPTAFDQDGHPVVARHDGSHISGPGGAFKDRPAL